MCIPDGIPPVLFVIEGITKMVRGTAHEIVVFHVPQLTKLRRRHFRTLSISRAEPGDCADRPVSISRLAGQHITPRRSAYYGAPVDLARYWNTRVAPGQLATLNWPQQLATPARSFASVARILAPIVRDLLVE